MELVLSLLATAAAIGSVVVAIIASGRAEAASERAASAESRAVDAAEKAAAASATIATIQSAIFEGPPWRIEHHGGDIFLLINTSPLAAVDVEVTGKPADQIRPYTEHVNGLPTIGAKSSIRFWADRRLGREEIDLVVTWSRPGFDERLTWRHPVPPVPR